MDGKKEGKGWGCALDSLALKRVPLGPAGPPIDSPEDIQMGVLFGFIYLIK